jgi:uncharacterized phage protein gp47/JayE
LLSTPTTQDLASNITNQLQASLGQSIPFLPKSFLRVLAKILAGVVILLYRYAGFILLQLFVTTASTQQTTVNGIKLVPLAEWGHLFGLGDPLAATRAILDISVPVTQQTGSLPPGSQLIHAPSGVVYVSTATVPLNASTVTVRVRAASDQTGGDGLGVIGNREPGDVLSFASPLPNVGRDATVSTVVVTAAEGESWDAYRQRILEFASARPQGGAYADYREWARSVAGIVAAYPYTGDPGEIDVYVEASVESSESPDGIPTEAQLTAVLAAIEGDVDGTPNRRPANAAINVYPISRMEFDLEIENVDASIRDQVEQALTDFYLSREPYIVGLSVLPRKDRCVESSLIGLIDDIVLANGLTWGSVTQFVDSEEQPAVTLDDGNKAKLGTITWVDP